MTNVKQYFLVMKIFDLDALLVIMNERLKVTTLKLNRKAIKRKIDKYPNQYLQTYLAAGSHLNARSNRVVVNSRMARMGSKINSRKDVQLK